MKPVFFITFALGLATSALAEHLDTLVADRTRIERVYYEHRLGTKPAFEQLLPAATIRRLVEADQRKEAVLKTVYGTSPFADELDAEVQRLATATRAPEMLAELNAALGNDPARFAAAVARPLVVDRELRRRYENDATQHAAARQRCEAARAALLHARREHADLVRLVATLREAKAGPVEEVSWHFGLPPASPASAPVTSAPTAAPIRAQSAAYSVEATAQLAQTLSAPEPTTPDAKAWFAELPADLQRVLQVQLRAAGDISAVVEMPDGFRVFVANERTAETLRVTSLTVPKLDFEHWLSEQKVAP